MADEGGERTRKGTIPVGPTGMPGDPIGLIPTGADQDSDGSSVELDAELATEEEIPSTEEILKEAEERKKGLLPPEPAPRTPFKSAATAMLPTRKGTTPEETTEKPHVPHDRGMGTSKE
ncbi:MAG: hypothetical protein QHH26_06855 [Armatimonadota bacterium]|nr:hypothetical protein [Armatimonadota bacterium]